MIDLNTPNPLKGAFFSVPILLSLLIFYVRFLSHRFADVHRNTCLSGRKGKCTNFVRPCSHSLQLFQKMHANPIDERETQKVHHKNERRKYMKDIDYEKFIKRSLPEKVQNLESTFLRLLASRTQ